MKNSLVSFVREFIKVIIIVAIAMPFISLFAAWSEPSQAPTLGNAEAPINVGTIEQVKDGILGAKYFRSFYETLLATDGGNVGIGTLIPTVKLDVNGQIRIRGGNPGPNKVLTSSDSGGTASWQGSPVSGGGLTYVGSCEIGAFNQPFEGTSCKCNNGEKIMLLEGLGGTLENGCRVLNQNTLNVIGIKIWSVDGNFGQYLSCYYACFK